MKRSLDWMPLDWTGKTVNVANARSGPEYFAIAKDRDSGSAKWSMKNVDRIGGRAHEDKNQGKELRGGIGHAGGAA